MQSTSTLVLVFTLFTAATTFGNFEFNLKLLSVRLLAAVLAFVAVAIVSWEPRALESTEIIEAASFFLRACGPLIVLAAGRAIYICKRGLTALRSRRSRSLRSPCTARFAGA